NKISNGQFLENLTNLNSLYLGNNQISDVRFLEKLTTLNSVDLSNNQISDVSFLEKLPALHKIVLTNNQLADLLPLRYFFEKKRMQVVWKYPYDTSDGEINVKDNPFSNPPTAIVEQGNDAILEYFRQKETAGSKPLLEAKMVLLGDGRAGKTSLACRMLGKELPRQEDRTQGVDIVIGEYSFPVEEGDFVLHIWDFAGQDKYKPLHQFFYTEGAVYVMVADSGNAQTDFADWFETAEMFGGEGSPLLVALNEFREGMGIGNFDEEKWRKQFPKLIKEVRLVNLLSQKGFPELEKDIRHLANQLPHTRTEYPANWANIRSELDRRRNENYISLPEYLNICRQFDLPERESALILSGILHRIGVCLHYQKNELLRLHVILKNEWATAAVYKILEDRTVAEEKKGFFDWSDLRRIWSDDSYQDMQPQLLALMCEFKMAYPLPKPNEFVTPPLLPPAPPQDWDFPTGEAIEVRVEYEFLPKALMTQFIVSRHPDIDRGRTLVWREGVVLRWSTDTLAQVSKIKSRGRDALQIQAIGSERRGLLTAILKTLRDLHNEYRGIRAHEIVPCSCEGCRTEKNPQHYFDFKNLSNRLEKGRRVVECDQSLEEVDLLKILGNLLLFEHLGVGEAVVLAKSEKPVQKSGITEEMVSTIREKLKKDKLEEALAYLETHAPTESILLQAQITRSAKNTQQGLDSTEQDSAIRQRTIRAILAWLENE
uniref:COR domain-containing protein n=1 Tax=Haliscomenobacter sp. TaxID=2717303 RepID=UPI003364F18E